VVGSGVGEAWFAVAVPPVEGLPPVLELAGTMQLANSAVKTNKPMAAVMR
jgi:hypothetical protein